MKIYNNSLYDPDVIVIGIEFFLLKVEDKGSISLTNYRYIKK